MLKVILCAYNEAQNLKKLLSNINYELKLLGRDFEIICCLDGTTDESLQVINDFKNSCNIRALPLINQRGLGLAFKRIFLDVIKNSAGDDLIISLDADNTHNPKQIKNMIAKVEQDNLDLLVVSRFVNESTMNNFPLHRKLISRSISVLLKIIFPIKKIDGKKLSDYTSGYRLYKAKILKNLYNKEENNFICEPEFTYTCELLIKLSQLNLRIDETPILYDYGQKIGNSKLRLIRNGYRFGVMITTTYIKTNFFKKASS